MRKKLGCMLIFIGLLCFVGFFASMFTLTNTTSRTLATDDLHYKKHELGYLIIYGTLTADSDLRSADITVRYYYKDSDTSHRAVLSFGKLKKGKSEVEILTDIPWLDPDDPTKTLDESEGRKPSIVDVDVQKPLTGLYVGLGFFFATALFWVLGGMTAGGEFTFHRKPKSEPQPSVDPFGASTGTSGSRYEPSPVMRHEIKPKQNTKTDLALEILDVEGVDLPWYHGKEARFDALNYTAMVTVHAFDAEKFFYNDPNFYDEVREELQKTSKFKVYADADINDFLFCCDMSRQEASWEDMLRIVCYDCYDDVLSSTEQRTVDRGKVVDVYKMLDKFSPDSMESFYAVYDRIPGDTCASKYRSYRLLCGGNSTLYVDSAARVKAKTVVQAVEEHEPIVQEVVPTPAETPVSITDGGVTVNRSQMLRRQSTAAARRPIVEEDGQESAQTPIERERLAEAFWERLDKKQVKAFKRATLEEKAALFRDLPISARPEVKEGFYYAVYDELGGFDEAARRDRFERLLKGRFGN